MKALVLTAMVLTLSPSSFAENSYPYRFSDYPVLEKEQRMALTVDALMKKTQLELDLLYSQLTAGPMPDGAFDGYVVFDDSQDNFFKRVLSIAVPSRLKDWTKEMGTKLWRGKTFASEKGSLINRVGIARRYPAKVYCGQSILDSRRESIILDYAYGDTIPEYVDMLDWPVTRKGLNIRDEIRMVRPSLYLGRAYIQGVFALNFILFNESAVNEENWQEVCLN
jgi:hypothetical protein